MSATWDEFVRIHVQAILDAALRILGNAGDAEDVAQEVFCEILRLGRMEQYFNQPALVRTIAVRRALDRLRRRRSIGELNDEMLISREPSASEQLQARELESLLRSGLSQLAARESEVFVLSVFEELSHMEIASQLKISKGAVAKALSTARGRLEVIFEALQAES